ncbi:hypothetical protein BOX37_07420 [Nocardia mangyaensis]|uniref:Uncharacterized protein n=1 Tax=Nocardia mangyaensis TaxID=2213200 RepID=A0A1J0VP86_9NOCA|nr:hypothetical protein BOX37_07420 [Nocardia mangyaensis]
MSSTVIRTRIGELAVTTVIIARLPPEEARVWLGHRSTNLHHLGEDPLRVLIGSAFWTDGGGWFATPCCSRSCMPTPNAGSARCAGWWWYSLTRGRGAPRNSAVTLGRFARRASKRRPLV